MRTKFHNTTSFMIINACIFTVRYVTHFIPGISLFIVCLHEEIDDGFAFLLFAGYKLWFPLFQDVSLAKVNPNRMLLESPIAKPPASDHPKCEDLAVTSGRWSPTRNELHGFPSQKRSEYVTEFVNDMCSPGVVSYCHKKFFAYSE